MDWEGHAFCLNSHVVVGQATSTALEPTRSPLGPRILVAEHLAPAELLPLLDTPQLAGVVLRQGSMADHTAGLLNGRGIQLAVVADLPPVAPDTPLLIDGLHERIVISAALDALHARGGALRAQPQPSAPASEALAYGGEPVAVHVDGHTADELRVGVQEGASGVGIMRTEWLGWNASTCPDVRTHAQVYAECAAQVAPHRLNVRLFDIGGDKIPRWATLAAAQVESPLGDRGVRAWRILPEAFTQQLQAICEVARSRPLGIVIPMVTDVSDILGVKQRLAELADEDTRRNIQLGAMVEVPAAALQIDQLLSEVDFIRIGPGDLTQFTLAKLRMHLTPADLSGRALHPAVLALIVQVAAACRTRGTPVSLCLDLEPRPALLQALLAVGLRTFAVSPGNVRLTTDRLRTVIHPQP